MKTTVQTCDICKQSKSEDDLSQISVRTRGITISENHYHVDVNFDICKDCLKKKGFIVESPQTEEELQETGTRNIKTLENKLLGILEDLGVQFYE